MKTLGRGSVWALLFALITSIASAQSIKHSGYWHNTTFGSFGPMTFYAERAGGNFMLTIDVEGSVFGSGPPAAPIVFAGSTAGDGGATFQIQDHPTFGDITGTFSPLGGIEVSLTDIPDGFVDSMTWTGAMTLLSVELDYRIEFETATPEQDRIEGADFALGKINAKAVTPPMFEWIYPRPAGDDYHALAAAAGGTAVAVGKSVIARSGNDFETAVLPAEVRVRTFLGVANDGTTWVALDDRGQIFRSDDGKSWTESGRLPDDADYIDVAAGDSGRFVFVGSGGHVGEFELGTKNDLLVATASWVAPDGLSFSRAKRIGPNVHVGGEGGRLAIWDGTSATLETAAPTGTISLYADNVSSGLEPVFSFSYSRNILMPDGTRREEQVSDYAYRLYRKMFGEDTPLPDYFVDAQSLSPSDHIAMQSAVQKYVDSSISKTINCPEDISFEAFKDIYMKAYDTGCKGCTTYRPNDITGAVLSVEPKAAENKSEPELPLGVPEVRPADQFDAGGVVYMTQPLERPEELTGGTYKLKWPDSEHAMYITINDVIQDGRRRPFEVFVNSKNMEHFAWTVALTRMISAVFRRGGDISFVVEELKAIFDPRGGQWVNGKYVPSLLAAIGDVIERHMIEIGFIPTKENHNQHQQDRMVLTVGKSTDGQMTPAPSAFRQCPKCGGLSLKREEGCDSCVECGYSKCG